MFHWLAAVVSTVNMKSPLESLPPLTRLRLETHGSGDAWPGPPVQSGTSVPLRKICTVSWFSAGGTTDLSSVNVNTIGLSAVAWTGVPSAAMTVMFACWLRNVYPLGPCDGE